MSATGELLYVRRLQDLQAAFDGVTVYNVAHLLGRSTSIGSTQKPHHVKGLVPLDRVVWLIDERGTLRHYFGAPNESGKTLTATHFLAFHAHTRI